MDVKPAGVSKEDLDTYIKQIYENEWYKTPKEISDSFNERFPTTKDSKSPQSGKAPHRPTVSKASVPRGVQQRREKRDSVPKGNEKPEKDEDCGPIKI
jgi:hypothetical protein